MKKMGSNNREYQEIFSTAAQIEPFTWTNLRLELRQAKQLGYASLTCREYCQRRKRGTLPDKFLVFRVDVDRSLKDSLEMATILMEENITATFFYRLHAPLYDLDASENVNIVRTIHNMGFEIGLHCEPLVVSHLTGNSPEAVLIKDLERLQEIIGDKVYGAASHGDARYPQINNLDFWKDHTPARFDLWYEAYDSKTLALFQKSRYVSDSELTRWKAYDNGKLRPGDHRPLQEHIIESESPLYILVHPFLFGARHLSEVS